MSRRKPYLDIFDAIGGWLEGEDVTSTDLWVASGLESESDHPERYRYDPKTGDYSVIEDNDQRS